MGSPVTNAVPCIARNVIKLIIGTKKILCFTKASSVVAELRLCLISNHKISLLSTEQKMAAEQNKSLHLVLPAGFVFFLYFREEENE